LAVEFLKAITVAVVAALCCVQRRAFTAAALNREWNK
jgi:hypothetical protein